MSLDESLTKELENYKVHRYFMNQYHKLEKNSETRLWSKTKFLTYKWGVLVPIFYGAAGGKLAQGMGAEIGVSRKKAVVLNTVFTLATDSLVLLFSNKVADNAFYIKTALTQGVNAYRFFYDGDKHMLPAFGVDAVLASVPYTKFIAHNTVKKAKSFKEDISSYYAHESFKSRQPLLQTVLFDASREFTKQIKKAAPLILSYMSMKKH